MARTRANQELPTVNLEAVEIMAAVGPVKGIGSPPEGDHWTTADLRAMAAAHQEREAAGESPPPATIGHFPKFSDPAVGALGNFRVSDDGTKLLADVRDVPRKFADLVKAKAYRSRSVDMKRDETSQATGKTYDWTVTGLAFGGGKMPAVKTLADVAVLYSDEEDAERHFVQIDEYDIEPQDVDRLFETMYDLAESHTKIAADLFASDSRRRSDTRRKMPDSKYTDEQRQKFADATERKLEDVTDELLANAGVPEPVEEQKKEERKTDDESGRALEEKFKELDAKVAAAEKRALEAECNSHLDTAIKDGRITPGEKPGWALRYETSPEETLKVLTGLPKNESAAREYGSDAEGDQSEEDARKFEEAFEADMVRFFGVSKEAII